MNCLRKNTPIIKTLIVCLVLTFGFNVTGYAAMVTTEQLTQSSDNSLARDEMRSLLNRDELREQLTDLGVDHQQALLRLDSMTNEEISVLAGNLENLPAGGDLLTAAAFVFIVLLFTDLMGYTDIFPFVKKHDQAQKEEPRSGPVVTEN